MIVFLLVTLFGIAYCQNYTLIKLTGSLADGAACLDGTPPAYYFRPGTGTGVNKWFLFFQGGGWCYSLSDCVARSKTVLGSSSTYPATVNYNSGYYSNSPTVNPLMYNWNVVYFQYCDGASFAGNNDTITEVSGTKLYFRGFKNLQAYLKDLNTNHELQKGTDFMISGCSAGGLATYLHVDWWKENLPASAKVRGLPDSGYFLDYNSATYAPKYGNYMRWVFQQQNVSSGVNQKCIASSANPADCIFAEHTVPYISTPIFPLQSRYDSWQLLEILGTNSVVDTVNQYGAYFVQKFQAVNGNVGNGYFFDSCQHHCGEWNSIKINGQLSGTAVEAWYNGAADSRFTQQDNFPCTACCTP